jgi:hypothetical protein
MHCQKYATTNLQIVKFPKNYVHKSYNDSGHGIGDLNPSPSGVAYFQQILNSDVCRKATA